MRTELPFRPVESDVGTVFRPLLTIEVSFADKTRLIEFLVDSGSDISLLGAEYAADFDMDFDEGRRRDIRGIHGPKVPCVEKKVVFKVPEFSRPFDSSVFIARDMRLIHNLLGRYYFFNQLRVGFDQNERKLVLDDRHGKYSAAQEL